MADVFSPKQRSRLMAKIRSVDTKLELRLRHVLHSLGYRYRLHVKGLPGKPDIVLPKYETAIQIRGCFWHGHTCLDGHIPKSRKEYWVPKLNGNKRRDARNDRKLRALGWKVIVVWECRCSSASKLEAQIARIVRILEK